MLFNSIDFAVFLPLVFLLYWFVFKKNLKLQNLFMVVASYFFYAWWDWRFLFLLIFSSTVDYIIGIFLDKENNIAKRKLLLFLSITVNIGILGFFKYFNFFVDSFVNAFSFLGSEIEPRNLNIILPVGISFYTFQTLSYTIDVYRKKLQPTKDAISFFAFVSFFPQLVAGPIERAANLLPQFFKKRVFDYSKASDGMRQILWGGFKKIVVADNISLYVNDIFNSYESHSGITLFVAAAVFGIQIYCDFSGYSDIAIGTARLFGFNLMRNFAYPYFSRNIAEFWRRWHISLSTWFRDYLYIPLGGSKCNSGKIARNILLVFVISGLWHGANWTFIIWGLLHAIYYLPLLLLNKNRTFLDDVAKNKFVPNFKEIFQMLFTFFLVTIAWIFFRSPDITNAYNYIFIIFTKPFDGGLFLFHLKPFILALLFLLTVEWLQRNKQHAADVSDLKSWQRYLFYFTVFCFIFFQANLDVNQFIYFQF